MMRLTSEFSSTFFVIESSYTGQRSIDAHRIMTWKRMLLLLAMAPEEI